MVKVVIVEDNELYRKLLQKILQDLEGFECYLAVGTGKKFLKYIGDAKNFDIAIIDIGLPDISGLDILKTLHNKNPNIELVVLSAHSDNNSILQALSKGANHYILKNEEFQNIGQQLISIKEGNTVLSPIVAKQLVSYFHPNKNRIQIDNAKLTSKEHLVLRFIIDGLSYKLIAANLGITINGVRYHIKNIYKKLQVNSKIEAIKIYQNLMN